MHRVTQPKRKQSFPKFVHHTQRKVQPWMNAPRDWAGTQKTEPLNIRIGPARRKVPWMNAPRDWPETQRQEPLKIRAPRRGKCCGMNAPRDWPKHKKQSHSKSPRRVQICALE
jgi:hypothetical protein